ncbi:MAG: endoribonuclease YicC domain-containing protein, partial [Planctomycetota bacterium]
NLEQIRGRAAIVLQEYADKLRKRVDKLLARAELKLDEETLAREVAVFADRSDISEEISRLDSHVQQFEQCCQTNDQSGRKLDFISQEMLREANTIASKASDIEITRCVVEMKCQIDRIKEQVQNVE